MQVQKRRVKEVALSCEAQYAKVLGGYSDVCMALTSSGRFFWELFSWTGIGDMVWNNATFSHADRVHAKSVLEALPRLPRGGRIGQGGP